MSLLTGELCGATVKTNEDSILYSISKGDFDNIISENPLLYKHFGKLLADRLNKQNTKSTQLKEHEIALSKYVQNTKEHQYSSVVGKCRAIKKTLQDAEDLSKLDDPITIIGEWGTGKEVFARKIHNDSARAKYPIVEFALPIDRRNRNDGFQEERRIRDHAACELFGNEKMIFADEVGKKIGRFELVDKGTLIIKNVENMPLSTQERLLKFLESGSFYKIGGDSPIQTNVRIIATTTDIEMTRKNLDSRLFRLLSLHKLDVPPLSKRKKDIPLLIDHFVDKISKVKHTQARTFSKRATNKLLKYDYPGNVKELENVIARAVDLSSDNIIEEEEIFLGGDDVEDKIRLNLLIIPLFRKFCLSDKVFSTVKIYVLVSYIVALYLILVEPNLSIGGKSVGLILFWQLAFPSLFLVHLFAARFGCGICPMSAISTFISRFANLKVPIPAFIKKLDLIFMGTGFVAILFVEEYTHMAHSTTKTAWLLLSILIGAIIFDFVFEKSAWCRYLCPLGGLGGLFGMSSLIEIRANKNTCTTICTTHDCYKGNEEVESCPMFLHLQFLPDNKDCKICLQCIKSCKHRSLRLNLRIPGAEIGTLRGLPCWGPYLNHTMRSSGGLDTLQDGHQPGGVPSCILSFNILYFMLELFS